MPRSNDRALTVKMPTNLYDELRARAHAEDRTVASLLRVLARNYLAGFDGSSPGNGLDRTA